MLLPEDIKQITAALTPQFAEIKAEINGMKAEINGIKVEVVGVKKEVAGIKAEINGMKAEVVGVKKEVAGIKTEIKGIKSTMVTKDEHETFKASVEHHFAIAKEDNESLRESVQETLVRNDGLAKVIDDHRREYGAIIHQLDEHEKWIQEVKPYIKPA